MGSSGSWCIHFSDKQINLQDTCLNQCSHLLLNTRDFCRIQMHIHNQTHRIHWYSELWRLGSCEFLRHTRRYRHLTMIVGVISNRIWSFWTSTRVPRADFIPAEWFFRKTDLVWIKPTFVHICGTGFKFNMLQTLDVILGRRVLAWNMEKHSSNGNSEIYLFVWPSFLKRQFAIIR